MAWESPSEKRIREYMESDGNGSGYIRSMEVGGIAPYRVAFWSQRGFRSLLDWVEKYPNRGEGNLSQIPNMAHAIWDEALEYNAHWEKTHGKLNKPVDEKDESFQELLRQHQELATLRARLKKMDDQAVQEQRRLKNKMERENATRYYAAIHQDPDQTLKIYEYL